MIKHWLVVGSPQNWQIAFENGNIWGLKQTQRHLWENLSEGDKLFFYVTSPVSGTVGSGTLRTKFKQDKPLWPRETKEGQVIWPLRFEFDVQECLPRDKWQAFKIVSNELFPRAGFQLLGQDLGQQLVLKLEQPGRGEYAMKTPPTEEIAETTGTYTTLSHDALKQRLIEIGRLQNYLAEEEYTFDIGRLDVVWRRVERSVPTYVFEVQVGGDVYHALAKLKHAFDLWNSHLFLVASQADSNKARNLLSGTFHEINDRVKFLELEKVEELYRRKKAYSDLEKELGI